ncbi:helix-turn-helix domain-containing protein [Amycolatopsis alkalitolerans]|uniref:Helix-turn-helix domain-containing protein n=1 Tax=Amycolatopsis alkalitolerans TaxID=2547244 RepID=A0A5C4M149_9PSEU|nr:helix-turn-helix transcriptional regulator [Amycolatopsis alkalitolerans]TNC25423.1 helix-turn-helix domain-containing protein [Amycolatopsis alkalitolerans]
MDNELGEFLRARRDLVSPRQAGLPGDGERRVPGLRREEVALLAGVSTDYYIRLEQGRERHPSDQVLDAIARALRLDEDGATHLFRLAMPAPQVATRVSPPTVDPELRTLMEHFIHAPATVLGPALDVLAANSLSTALYAGFARFDNLARMVFLDPAAVEFYLDWDSVARSTVASLRAASAPFHDDPRVSEVVGELTVRSPAFASYWARHEVRPRRAERKRFRHPLVGELEVHAQALSVTNAPGQQLFVYSAEPGSPSADGLTLLGRLSAEPAEWHTETRTGKGNS